MTETRDARQQRRTALDLYRAGQFKKAAETLHDLLRQTPTDAGALLMLGDVEHDAGNTAEATKAYTGALQVIYQSGVQIPSQMQGELQRAQSRLDAYKQEYENFLAEALPIESRSQRLQQSIDIMLGKSRVFLQEPTRFYYPALPQIELYDSADFDWVPELESKTSQIKAELMELVKDHAAFSPYIPRNDGRPHLNYHTLVDNDNWGAFYLWKEGERQDENCARCPDTAAAMEKVPLDFLEGRAPSVLFSLLKPGAHIPPHNGMLNTRLICHLPVLVPGPAWLRVGNTMHHWQEGKIVVFDDSIEHEAKNDADQTRVVLLFDIWRPEFKAHERGEITKLLNAIGRFSD